ncbi:hypothetical protein KO525_08530 [Psychrosphaera sp. B3R10]|nr:MULTISPECIES: hypothetical protein [unclassified Psychrosphaera]MBU2989419.1 hypothetical protein [Psychrosphaera sp. B3R10]MDO6718253.1 hypothetical protein [Psychrosphaera sp. 1_MG-2023]
MIRLFFLLPLILCFIWWLYLKNKGWTIEQGKQGFYYIIGLTGVMAVFFGLMYLLNHHLK